MCAPLLPSWLFTLTVSKEMNNLARLSRIFIRNWAGLSLGITLFQQLDTSYDWFYPMADLSSSGWIRVAADSILQLTQVSLAGYELLLTQSHNWLEFRRLETSYSWLHPTANSSSRSLVRLKADSILRLTISCGWLEFRQLGTSYSWLHPTADSSSSSWIRLLRLIPSCDWL